jgi:hypothetical protein
MNPDPILERFIGCLTMAFGVGVILRAAALSGYLTDGQRPVWSIGMLAIGAWLLVASFLRAPRFRIVMLGMCALLYAALFTKLFDSGLYGAAIQSLLTVLFSLLCIHRIVRWTRDK